VDRVVIPSTQYWTNLTDLSKRDLESVMSD